MNRSLVGWIIAFALAIAGSAVAWVWFAGGSGEPSTELTTPTIAVETSTTEAADPSTTAPTTAPTSFVIDSAQTVASFEIDEELRGSPQRVIGETDQVAGQIQVDLSDLTTAEFSQIIVNARTFTTDSSRRDRAIRGPVILNSASDEFELISFDVTAVDGLSGSAAPGDTFEFSVTGDLEIKGVTNEVAFDLEVTVVDGQTIQGSGATTVSRSDFGIGIPSVPGVANVGEEVALSLDFVAIAG